METVCYHFRLCVVFLCVHCLFSLDFNLVLSVYEVSLRLFNLISLFMINDQSSKSVGSKLRKSLAENIIIQFWGKYNFHNFNKKSNNLTVFDEKLSHIMHVCVVWCICVFVFFMYCKNTLLWCVIQKVISSLYHSFLLFSFWRKSFLL